MSIFYCHACDQLRDSDNGCEEIDDELVCQRCADRIGEQRAEEEMIREGQKEDQASAAREEHRLALRAEALKHGIIL